MKGYLQRLAERAEGVALLPSSPSIAPAGHRLINREATPDPFAQSEPTTSFVRPNRTPAVLQDPIPDKDQASRMIPVRRRLGRSEPAMIEDISGPSGPKSMAHPMTIEPPPSLAETPSPVLKKTDFRKAFVENLENGPVPKAKSARPRVHEVIEPFVTERPSSETLSIETRAPVVTTSRLEPPRDDTLRSEPLASEEPRLVIGQLRVDVVPTAPTQAREVVRTVIRTGGPSQSTKLNRPTSRLRFGLGQM